MRLPILDNEENDNDVTSGSQSPSSTNNNAPPSNGDVSPELDMGGRFAPVPHYPPHSPSSIWSPMMHPSSNTWTVMNEIEARQYNLASALLMSSKGTTE